MQLRLNCAPIVKGHNETDIAPRAIECDDFPFEQLSRIAESESWRKEIHRPIYHIHKWWARRLGSVFRGILIGALAPQGSDVIELFYSPVRFPDTVVFDPFMGSGTTLGETLKAGGIAIGRDINPVSYLQVRTALTLNDSKCVEKAYKEIAADVAETISGYYTTRLPDGSVAQALYYFWVMQATCPDCHTTLDLFSSYIFAKHVNLSRNPIVRVVCPICGDVSAQDYRVRGMECARCGSIFDAACGPVSGKAAKCPSCRREFAIGRAIRESGAPPSYRMYAKLAITPDGEKQYYPVTEYDEALYRKAGADVQHWLDKIPSESIAPGYNTNQVLNYGFTAWRQMFNARQLLCISLLADRIKKIEDTQLRYSFACLLSGVLEFNNMFASYKGEGTGAVRHTFNHHILKPERTPLEANLWGTPKSSGAFSTLFRSRLLKAVKYAQSPFELALPPVESSRRYIKVDGINEPITENTNSESYAEFERNSKLYISCDDSAVTDLPSGCVDLVITDPPFFDNVHYSQLADFFYVWQKVILNDSPYYQESTTRSASEVQNSDAETFTRRLTSVFQEIARVLKNDGLFVFTYHHSRWEGWKSVLKATVASGFHIEACHPVKSEMAVAIPKQQAKNPINFDIIIVCRKNLYEESATNETENWDIATSVGRAEAQIARLRTGGWKLSRNDVGIVIMAQVAAEISRNAVCGVDEHIIEDIGNRISSVIDGLENPG